MMRIPATRNHYPRIAPRDQVWRLMFLLGLTLVLNACAVAAGDHRGPGDRNPALEADYLIAHDGYQLPLRQWSATDSPRGAVLALHGFNDYGGAFSVLADDINELGLNLYAYDQRGFGETEPAGIWPGQELLVQDALTASHLLRERYGDKPLYLMGKSMGGGISILALTAEDPAPVDGTILISPGVWGRDIMPWYQRFGIWVGEGLMPGLELSVEMAQNIGIEASDDEDVLQALADDPLVQGGANLDSISGVTGLMGAALQASEQLPGPTLILYGDQDEIIPEEPFCKLLDRLPEAETTPWRLALYPGGYHMLTRYSGAEQVHGDIMAWLRDTQATLPSGRESTREKARQHLCE